MLVEHVVCPLCGWNRVLYKKGSRAIKEGKYEGPKDGMARFDVVDVRTGPFIDIRAAEGIGFPRVETKTIREAAREPQYLPLLEQAARQAKALLQEIREAFREALGDEGERRLKEILGEE
mgnify:FL=1